MKTVQKLLCIFFTLVFAAALPFLIPSGNIPEQIKADLLEEKWAADDDTGLLSVLFPTAYAQELTPLPIDFTPGKKPNASLFTKDGYTDDSIQVELETREENGVIYRICFVTVKHPSQLRTAMAGGLQSSKVAMISNMAQKNHAVLAFNADYLSNNPTKTTFEYRMGNKIRAKFNSTKDTLIIDENGDFHLLTGKDKKQQLKAFETDGHKIINAFTFGPALVKDKQVQSISKKYGYNPYGKEPRIAIGQLDTLSYVVVLAEGRLENSQGVTLPDFANFMADLGCTGAFNLDGGNSATLIYNNDFYQDKSAGNERAQSDMIYFATLVDHQ